MFGELINREHGSQGTSPLFITHESSNLFFEQQERIKTVVKYFSVPRNGDVWEWSKKRLKRGTDQYFLVPSAADYTTENVVRSKNLVFRHHTSPLLLQYM